MSLSWPTFPWWYDVVSTRATAELGRGRSCTRAAESQTSPLETVGLPVALLEFLTPPTSDATLYSASPGESSFSDPSVACGNDGSVRRIVADFGRGCEAACGVVLVFVRVCVGFVCWSQGAEGEWEDRCYSPPLKLGGGREGQGIVAQQYSCFIPSTNRMISGYSRSLSRSPTTHI